MWMMKINTGDKMSLRKRKRKLIVGVFLLLLSLAIVTQTRNLFSEHADTKLPEEVHIPEYCGNAYVEINGGKPFFETEEITTKEFEIYSDLGTRMTIIRSMTNTKKSDRDNYGLMFSPTAEERGERTYTVYAVLPDGTRSADCLILPLTVK